MEQPRLVDAPVEEKIKIPPIASLKARILALQKGIPYPEAVQRLLDEENKDRQAEREAGHAP